jgi:hypothetical protein
MENGSKRIKALGRHTDGSDSYTELAYDLDLENFIKKNPRASVVVEDELGNTVATLPPSYCQMIVSTWESHLEDIHQRRLQSVSLYRQRLETEVPE